MNKNDFLKEIDRVAAAGPYQPNWKSLADYSIPAWYQDAKFGIFIHWGVYAVPAYGDEWYPRYMYIPERPEYTHHRVTYGPQDRFGYKDFIPRFTADRYDPAHWAELFRRSGAKYVVPVAEHHDGFAMYDCSYSRWTAVKMGPKRDVLADLAAAVQAAGLVFGVSSHRAEHWFYYNSGMEIPSDVQEPTYRDFYGPAKPRYNKKDNAERNLYPDEAFLDDWLMRTCELVDKYQPQLVYFDWWIDIPPFAPYLQKFAAYYYNRGAQWQRGVALNYKYEAFPPGVAVLDIERGQMRDTHSLLWQTCTSVSRNSWGYVDNQDYKTAESLVHDLIDIVSKNGTLLLNIGPRADGTIPEREEQILLEIGRWLEVNGEAIYATRPWKIFGEGPTEVPEGNITEAKRQAFSARDIRFTTKRDTLYVILLGWPEGGEVIVQSLSSDQTFYPEPIGRISLLGSAEKITWTRDVKGLKVKLPLQNPGIAAFALKIEKG